MFGQRIPATAPAAETADHPHPYARNTDARVHADDSPEATQLLRIGAPTACPTCGSFTTLHNNLQGWRCTNSACVQSTPPRHLDE